MTQFFDIRTLSVVMGVTVFVLGLSMAHYSVNRKTYAGFGAWTTGTILFSLAFFLIALRQILPSFITIVVANGLIYSAFALFYLGFKSFADKKGNPYLHIVIVLLLSLLLVPFFTYVAPSVNVRISLISFAAALYFFFCTRILVREIQYDLVKLNKILAGTLILLIILFIFRGIFFLLPENTINSFMTTSVIHGVVFLAGIILAMLFVTGLMQLNSQMLERELYSEQGQLRESEDRYRALFENMSDGVAIYEATNEGEDFTFIDFNKAGERIDSTNKEALIGKGVLEVFPGVKEFGLFDVLKRVWKTDKPEHHPVAIYKDERIAGWRDNFVYRLPSGEIVAIYSDKTERRQAEEALRASEEKYRQLADLLPQTVFETDEKGDLTFANRFAFDIFGYTSGDFEKGLNALNMLVPEDRDGALENIARVLKGKWLGGTEYTALTKGGNPFPVMIHASPIIREDKTVGLRGIITDLTELKETEGALRESEERFRTVADFTYDWEYWIAPDGHYIYVSPSCERITGYGPEAFVNDPGLLEKIAHPDDHSTVVNHFGEKQNLEKLPSLDFRLITRSGDVRWISHVCQAVYGSDGAYLGRRGSNRDISKEKQIEAQLQQAQKMEAIATLAGGVAHEFNNALMGIMGNIELLKTDLPKDERRDKYFEAMNNSGHRMSRLTDQLLAYAQGGKYQPRELKLDDFVIQTLPILQRDLSPEVRVETHFPKDISYIKVDHTQMQMVLDAILANSDEAIEDVGLIKITAENKDLDEDFTKQHAGLKPGPYVYLTIEDDGKGMDEETKSGIFEPFFTTKFQGRGMGMAAVYGIIKGHDGAITVGSEPGKGTVVRIYLPAISAERKEQETTPVKQPELEIPMGEGTILIIEDEELLVKMFREILEILGYRVLQAETGKEAVDLAKTFDGQIDLALLDIKLPDMEGGRVYPLIMEARPDLKVIVCSGYSIHGPAQDILDAGAEGFIQKPFSIAAFAEKLKEILEGK